MEEYHLKNNGKIEADNLFNTMEQMPVTLKDTLTNEVFKEAGRLKSTYKLSLVTADHHEIEPIEKAEQINVTWFR